jgi:hypothetical protein
MNYASSSIDPAVARSRVGFAPAAARAVMGLLFLIMGLNGLLMFLPQPKGAIPPHAIAFLGALAASGYMTQLVSATQVVVAIMLLSNRFVPLALVLIAPVIVNIVAFHGFLYPTGAAILAVLAALLELYLAWIYRDVYRPMLAMRV